LKPPPSRKETKRPWGHAEIPDQRGNESNKHEEKLGDTTKADKSGLATAIGCHWSPGEIWGKRKKNKERELERKVFKDMVDRCRPPTVTYKFPLKQQLTAARSIKGTGTKNGKGGGRGQTFKKRILIFQRRKGTKKSHDIKNLRTCQKKVRPEGGHWGKKWNEPGSSGGKLRCPSRLPKQV